MENKTRRKLSGQGSRKNSSSHGVENTRLGDVEVLYMSKKEEAAVFGSDTFPSRKLRNASSISYSDTDSDDNNMQGSRPTRPLRKTIRNKLSAKDNMQNGDSDVHMNPTTATATTASNNKHSENDR